MNKLVGIMLSAFFIFGNANAIEFSIGASGTAGFFDMDGSEKRTESSSTIRETSKSEDVFIGHASVFGEVHLNENIRVGVNYIPYALESETTESTHISPSLIQEGTGEADRSQKVQVDLENMTTAYLSVFNSMGLFVKAGLIQGDLVTNESLDTGSSYGNTTIDGFVVGAGYEKNLNNGLFVRAEVNYNEYDDISLSSTPSGSGDSHTNKIDVKNLNGYSGAISIGKTF